MLRINGINSGKGVVTYAVLLKQFYAIHSLVKGSAVSVLTIGIMKHRLPVDANANQKIMGGKEFTPGISQQGRIGLEGIVYFSSDAILALVSQRPFVKIKGNQANSTMAFCP